MKTWIACVLLCFFNNINLCAQPVLYSSAVSNPATTNFEVIGKAGNFYWVQENRKPFRFRKKASTEVEDRQGGFEVYDERLNRVNTVPYTLSGAIEKQYVVAGPHSFDQVLIATLPDKTYLLRNRFRADGTLLSSADTLALFPSHMKGDDFLLARSSDRTKLLLLAFEPIEDAPPRVHAIVYDENWNVLFQKVYDKAGISQPFLQYDFTNAPLESFDNSPVKVVNNGDWLLVAPSRRSNNYVLWHFQLLDSTVTQTEIKQAQRGVQTVSLALDEAQGEACAGLLSNTNAVGVKKVRVAHYVLSQCHLDCDTIFRFSTLVEGKKEENLFEQNFMALPSKGFLYLKEYGRPFVSEYASEAATNDEDTPANATVKPVAFRKNDYTRYADLSNAPRARERGDLSLYYFPATQQDTVWSGFINQAQTGELNAPFLSYCYVPLRGKMVLLYNSLNRNDTKAATATILDGAGRSLNDEGVVFWRFNNVLDFQKARQIAPNEVAVPYTKNGNQGFAIIRL